MNIQYAELYVYIQFYIAIFVTCLYVKKIVQYYQIIRYISESSEFLIIYTAIFNSTKNTYGNQI